MLAAGRRFQLILPASAARARDDRIGRRTTEKDLNAEMLFYDPTLVVAGSQKPMGGLPQSSRRANIRCYTVTWPRDTDPATLQPLLLDHKMLTEAPSHDRSESDKALRRMQDRRPP
jgi:hypothetical protein